MLALVKAEIVCPIQSRKTARMSAVKGLEEQVFGRVKRLDVEESPNTSSSENEKKLAHLMMSRFETQD